MTETSKRVEYDTDGNPYVLSITNGKELEQKPCEDCISRQVAIRIAEQGQVQGLNGKYGS